MDNNPRLKLVLTHLLVQLAYSAPLRFVSPESHRFFRGSTFARLASLRLPIAIYGRPEDNNYRPEAASHTGGERGAPKTNFPTSSARNSTRRCEGEKVPVPAGPVIEAYSLSANASPAVRTVLIPWSRI